MRANEDNSDVDRVLAGDPAAFAGIVQRWQGPLINLAYQFFRDRSRAEDMAQSAFLRAFRSLKSWHREAAFSTWLFALATNLYRTELRRHPARTVSLDEVTEPGDAWSGPRRLEERDRDRAVRRAVDALPEMYRDAVILYYFHDLDIGAAAQSLGLPQGTLKARLFRGRALLRDKLAPLQFERLPKEVL